MVKDTRFVVKFESRRDATLFYNAVQKQLKKERAFNGYTEYDHVSYWKSGGGLMVVVHFKDPMSLEEVKGFSGERRAEWKLLPFSYALDDLLKLEWS